MGEEKQYTLIPMKIEAMLLSENDKSVYAEINPNFNSLRRFPSGSGIEPSPFTSRLSKESEEVGIHLHWILPKEATHGKQEKENGEIAYPRIPNRYLVTRLAVFSLKNTARTERKTWIVESDSLKREENAQNKGSETIPAQNDLRQTYRFLGEKREFKGTITEGMEHLEYLNVCINGSPYYAAYYPQCRNVLAFHDTMEDLEEDVDEENAVKVSYVVTGWYDTDCENGFSDHIYHGMIEGIEWKGRHVKYPSGVPQLDNIVKVSIGSSSAQAMAALVAFYQRDSRLERVVESLMEERLQDWCRMDGIWEEEYRTHENGFRVTQARRMTDICKKENEKEETEQTVHNLNGILVSIRGWEKVETELFMEKERLRQELVDIWHSYAKPGNMSIDSGKTARIQIMDRIQHLCKLGQCHDMVKTHTGKKLEKLKKYVGECGNIRTCVDQRFFVCNNPVVMLEGAGKNSLLDSREEEEECYRTKEEIVREKEGITAMEILKPLFPVKLSQMPDKAEERDREILDIAQDLIGEALIEKNMPYYSRYEPQWNPLILEWEVEFYPDSQLQQENYTFKNWDLEGLDFVYREKTPYLKQKEVYRGRTVLTSHASCQLKKAAERFIKVRDGTYIVEEMPYQVLSQALTGFRENLIMRMQKIQYPVKDFHNLDAPLAEMVETWTKGADTLTADYKKKFYPVLAGFLRFTAFRVIDTFGRALEFNPAAVIAPGRYQTVQEQMNTYLVLPPRLMQPSRIFFQWRDVKTDIPCVDMEETSPISGWIWPNFSESSLLIYGPEGDMLGSLQTVYDMDTGVPKATWRNAPGEHYLEKEYPEEMTQEMRDILDGIQTCAQREPDIITDILQMLDESFWNIHCSDMQETDSSYAVLGHPIAVAGASIALELQGKMIKPPISLLPSENPSYAKLDQTEFTIRFGNPKQKGDGVIGFYDLERKAPYERLHVCGIEHKKNGNGNTEGYLYESMDIQMPISKNQKNKKMTFLLSPYGKMHIISGFLPVKTVSLPRMQVSRAMKKIFYTLYTAPVLSSSDCLFLPYPHTEKRKWSYLVKNGDGLWEEIEDIKAAEENAFFGASSCELLEGWMKQKEEREEEVETNGGANFTNWGE